MNNCGRGLKMEYFGEPCGECPGCQSTTPSLKRFVVGRRRLTALVPYSDVCQNIFYFSSPNCPSNHQCHDYEYEAGKREYGSIGFQTFQQITEIFSTLQYCIHQPYFSLKKVHYVIARSLSIPCPIIFKKSSLLF